MRQAYADMLARLVDMSRPAALALALGAALVSAAAIHITMTRLSINTDTAAMLDPRLPFRQARVRFEQAFPQLVDLIVVLVEADGQHRAHEAADRLAAELRRRADEFPYVYQPGRGAFFARNGLLYLDREELQKLGDRLAEAQPFLGALNHDPSLRGLFSALERALDERGNAADRRRLGEVLEQISATADTLLAGTPHALSWREVLLPESLAGTGPYRSFILAQPRLDYTKTRPAAAALEAVHRLAEAIEAEQDGVRVRLTGDIPIKDDELRSVSADARTTAVIAIGLILIVLALGLRSARVVTAVLLTLGFGLACTAAFAALVIGSLNLISATFAVLFFGLGVDFGIQFATRCQEEYQVSMDWSAALRRAAAGAGGMLTLAAVATAGIFLSFVLTDFRGLAELGLISAFGMLAALAANLTLLPALLHLFGTVPRSRSGERLMEKLCLRLLMVKRNRRLFLAAIGAVLLGAFYELPRVHFDFNPIRLKDSSSPPVAAFLSLAQDPATTPYTIDVLARDAAEAETIAARLKRLDVTERTVTLATYVPASLGEKRRFIDDMKLILMPLLVQAGTTTFPPVVEELLAIERFRAALIPIAAGDDALAESARRLVHSLSRLTAAAPHAHELVTAFRRLIIGDLPQLLEELRLLLSPDLSDITDIPQDLRRRYVAPDGTARVEVFPKEDLRDNRAMRRFVRETQTVAPTATGAPVLFVEAGDTVVRACLQATAIALAAAVVLFAFTLRSLLDAMLVMLPVALSAVLTAAGAVRFGIPLNLANLIALPLLLGLSIAFGVYLVRRIREARSVERTLLSSTPRAVLLSALTTAVSFGSLVFSAHPGMASMGQLLMLALLVSLIANMLVLPAVMVELESRWRGSRARNGIAAGPG